MKVLQRLKPRQAQAGGSDPNVEIRNGIAHPLQAFWQQNFRKIFWLLALIVCIAQLTRILTAITGDFPVHHEFGRRILAGEFIYEPVPGGDPKGHDHPYPPLWAMVHAPFSLLPVQVAHAVCFPLFILSLGLLLFTIRDCVRLPKSLHADHIFWLMALTILASSRFLVRDMLECGVNLLMVALSWAAFWLWRRNRDLSAGGVLGLAIALKCTPALFAGYFLFKRQWKLVGMAVVSTIVLSASPMLMMGPDDYSEAMGTWIDNAVMTGLVKSDGQQGILGEEPLQNMSLKPAFARFLTRLPEGHLARLDDPLYIDFLNFSARTANRIGSVLMGCLALGVMWSFRRPVTDRLAATLNWECAIISLAVLLYSPITWGQHCVGVLPIVFFLIVRADSKANRGAAEIPGMHRFAFWSYIIITVVLNRAIVGQRGAWLIDAYHLQTWTLLGLMLVAMDCHRRAHVLAAQEETPDAVGAIQPTHILSFPGVARSADRSGGESETRKAA